jgi:hypothetical protein
MKYLFAQLQFVHADHSRSPIPSDKEQEDKETPITKVVNS